LILAAAALALAEPAPAYGPHDNECIDCHGIHSAKGQSLIAVEPYAPQNPATGATVKDISTLCLGCHSTQGGILEIDLMQSHPIGIIPKRSKVPAANLSLDGTITCISCHDPHPSNPNYKYLRGNVTKSTEMGSFCGICHPDQRE
jgi:predicted CXXCH cytochrome family protein